MQLEGKITDYGDLVHQERWIIKGKRLRAVLHVGRHRKATAAERDSSTTPRTATPGKVDHHMDLMADQGFDLLAPTFTDEMGNATDAPADYASEFSVSDTSILAVTDNGDGTAFVAATGTLGQAVLTATYTFDGRTVSGDELVTVVAGLAERVTLNFGEPREVTPDA
ncbi:hypothetical protein [Actinophytocola sp.]|uniref:hypothetical protein n=1 Tax=Actinophytocola sp. TaxID=1872138 RepID=UPI002D7E42E8|nr:hypothetical protein [Actinophytocola sp.]HET9144053.1 hypothetical protein [Actinophytocola sp.]